MSEHKFPLSGSVGSCQARTCTVELQRLVVIPAGHREHFTHIEVAVVIEVDIKPRVIVEIGVRHVTRERFRVRDGDGATAHGEIDPGDKLYASETDCRGRWRNQKALSRVGHTLDGEIRKVCLLVKLQVFG